MSKRESLLRCFAIYNRVRKSPASLEEIKSFLNTEAVISGYDFDISTRTFQRDLDDIRSILGADIQYESAKRKYVLKTSENDGYNDRLLEAFETYNVLKESRSFSDHLDFEKIKGSGLNYFHGLLHAIKNRLQLNFNYQSFWDKEPSLRKSHPYFLKEFKNRWYLVALDLKSEIVKTYALDRILDIDITKKRFPSPKEDPKEKFENCYGIIGSVNDSVPERVVLSFDTHQGRYVKSLPLHHSQNILIDSEDELRIELKLYIAFDFIKELLSCGSSVKVIEPVSLIQEMEKNHRIALLQYS